ncbi:unnamed protein product [Ostreobium quekettii]|uniref:Methyltransferase type 11 domain-containing protein n=1 Tax=Ostreobium quekettii TaxID=121088 RepID=A0A8S1IYS8_9CHLO|nr:unnamed protein product [Ostreobium quekettii]
MRSGGVFMPRLLLHGLLRYPAAQRPLPGGPTSRTLSQTASSNGVELFTDRHQADAYARWRPTYPPALYADQIYRRVQGFGLAVDVATGSGQVAAQLAKKFDRVVATDPSRQQLEQAPRLPNVTYSVGTAESIDLPPSSADLITVGNGLHWLDLPKFYAECRRVLKPRGTVAAWGYGLFKVPSHPKATEALLKLHTVTLGPYWDKRRKLLDSGYKGMEPARSAEFEQVERETMMMESDSSIHAVMGYLASWSSYATYKKMLGDKGKDPLVDFKEEFMASLGATEDSHAIHIVRPLSLIIATGPNKGRS